MENKISVITGATGHIGYALLKELATNGENVRILIRSDSKVFDGIPCEKFFGDVTDEASLEAAFAGADVVYHLAGIIDIGNIKKEIIWNVNVQGTKNVVEACKKCGVRRLIYASSVDAMLPLPGNELITEKSSYSPNVLEGEYGKSKATATQYVLDSKNESFEVVAVLPGACIGPYDFKVSSVGEMVRMVMRGGMPVSLAFGGYNFVDVRDVAKGMIGAAKSGRSGESYQLTGEIISADGIIRLVAEKCGKKPPSIKLPLGVATVLAPLAEVYYKISHGTPLFTRLSIKIINYNCNFSYKKAADELGYQPMSIKQSVNDMVDWIVKHEGLVIKK